MTDTPSGLIRQWLKRQVPEATGDWFAEQLETLTIDPSDRNLHIAFGMAPRRLGKDDLALTPDDIAAAQDARPGWSPGDWSVDEAARIALLCAAGSRNRPFSERFTELCRTADVGEAIALYRGLPLYPEPEALEAQAAEGLRTNMRAIFEAVAHHSPYPRERFDENRWNHMVLKALFIDSTLHPIEGLDERANPELARILCDYAHERWAAGRPVTPELWRCVGPFAEGAMLADLERVAASANALERKAAALALAASPDPAAADLLASLSDHAIAIASGDLTWDSLALEIQL